MRRGGHGSAPAASGGDVVRLKPQQYIHVHDNNANVTTVVLGPTTFTRQDHEQILTHPQHCIVIPPRHWCTIENPVMVTSVDGKRVVQKDRHGQAKVRLGDREIRFEQEPFPLYHQEKLVRDEVLPLQVLPVNKALRLRALRDVPDHQAGDEWLFEGPGTYIPRVEEEIVQEVAAQLVRPNTGLLLKARAACVDRLGRERKAGEEWLHTVEGAYLPGVDEEVVTVVNALTLTDDTAVHLECVRNFTDVFGKARKAGEQWLVTNDLADTYVPGPNERVRGHPNITTLTDRQFCCVLDPWKDGRQMLGQKEVRNGRCSFFLQPGESLENGIENVHILGQDEALLLTAREAFVDTHQGAKKDRRPGDRWMIYGPRDYIPPVTVQVITRRSAIALGENEGIYVRDTKSGQVRAVIGATYMLEPDEELWEKELPPAVTEIVSKQGGSAMKRGTLDLTRVVTYNVPHNCALQVYDYKSKRARIVWGPDMVKLGPDEQFTVVKLSGDKPKRPGVITAMALFLGPDFMTDILVVETSDHARLRLQLAYNWFFDVKYGDATDGARIFNVPDFVGDACSALASRIRGAVAAEKIDEFHKNSSSIIKAAVFGVDKVTGQPKTFWHFPNNGFTVTSVDIQAVEPVGQETRDLMMKFVTLAIQITTKSQEDAARHQAERLEQTAKGQLERQVLADKALVQEEKKELLRLRAESATIESTGASGAEARANAAAAKIEGESQVKLAQMKAEAARITDEACLEAEKNRQDKDLEFKEKMNAMEIAKAKALADIEVSKFKSSVNSIGRETIAAMARAGPEMQANLLKGLGLQGYMLTDGTSPINLMNTANSMVGQA